MRLRAFAAAALLALLSLAAPARACTLTNSYALRDGNVPQVLRSIAAIIFTDPDCRILPLSAPSDATGNPLATAPGTSAPSALAVQGVAGGAPLNTNLPSGAATAANQATANGALGAPGDSAYAGSGSSSIVAALKGLYGLLSNAATSANQTTELNVLPPARGQQAPGSSLSVVAANDNRPSGLTISAADAASTPTTGQNGAPIITGAPTANSAASFAVNGVSTARFQLAGTWSATLQFEQSIDGGTTWGLLACHVNGTLYTQSAVTGDGIFDCEASGATNVRARATALSSGSAVVTMVSTVDAGVVKLLNSASIKDNASGNSATIKGASTAPGASDPALVVAVSPNSQPLSVLPNAITWTQTQVTLVAGVSQTLIAANPSRKALRWMDVGTSSMTVAPGAVTVTAGVGMNYDPGAGSGRQGGAEQFVPGEMSTQAFSAISAAGTIVTVWEGQ